MEESHVLGCAALSPLKWWPPDKVVALPGGVWVKHLPEPAKPDFAGWKSEFNVRDIESLRNTVSWLRYDFSYDPAQDSSVIDDAMELVHNTAVAFQVAAPVGSDGLVIRCRKDNDTLTPESAVRYLPLHSTRWARMVGFEQLVTEDLYLVVEGVHQAFLRKVVRLQNPLYLLEHGLQATNIHISFLLWTMALDALLMAANARTFIKRLCNFLGGDIFVFPGLELFGQPHYRVADVAGDMYCLRSAIAHGKEIPKRYRQACGFRDSTGKLLNDYEDSYQYREVLEECSLFLVCRALRKVFLSNLLPKVGNEKLWRVELETPS